MKQIFTKRNTTLAAIAFFIFLGGRALAAGNNFELLFADKLATTEGIAYCPDGNLYVVENGSGTVYRIVSDTELERYWQGLSRPAGLACGPDNTLYALEYPTGKIIALTKGDKGVEAKTLTDKLTTPNAAAVLSDGTLLVSETDKGRVSIVDKTGAVTKLVDGIQYANGIALSEDESIAYIDATTPGKVFMAPLDEKLRGKKKVFKDGLKMPDGIVRAGDGSFYVCLYATGQIAHMSADGTESTIFAEGLTSPASPVIYNASLYITSLNGKGIYKIDLPEKMKK
jgi:sugar lactone lactonase YvrE